MLCVCVCVVPHLIVADLNQPKNTLWCAFLYHTTSYVFVQRIQLFLVFKRAFFSRVHGYLIESMFELYLMMLMHTWCSSNERKILGIFVATTSMFFRSFCFLGLKSHHTHTHLITTRKCQCVFMCVQVCDMVCKTGLSTESQRKMQAMAFLGRENEMAEVLYKS